MPLCASNGCANPATGYPKAHTSGEVLKVGLCGVHLHRLECMAAGMLTLASIEERQDPEGDDA